MPAHAGYADELQRRPLAAPSWQDRRDLQSGPASRDDEAGIGAIFVASVWLVFYVVAAVHPLVLGN